jgi:hypothetical protein
MLWKGEWRFCGLVYNRDFQKISALLEDGATSWLSEELDRLKPWWQMFQLGEQRRLSIDCEERFDHYQRLYETKRATWLCERYRKYFPEDEEEIWRVCDNYDRFFFICNSSPAVNGLTEGFWD